MRGSLMMAGFAGAAGFMAARLIAALVYKRKLAAKSGSTRVRPAGPENMTNPPLRWGTVDEMSDESFPASDPPAVY